ncbi:MAG: LysR family transcriptional regulator [Planctomycetota bacterium]
MAVARRHKELGLGQLRAFRECVRRQSFSAAARELGISQPAVWQQIRALERLLAVTLFEKRGRELALTDDGRILLDHVAELLGAADSLRDNFRASREGVAKKLVVIGTSGVLTEDLAEAITAFRQECPDLQLKLVTHVGSRTLDMLLGGDADLAIVPAGTEVVGYGQLLASEVVRERRWVVALATGHPLCRRREVGLADIVQHPLIIPEQGSGWRQFLDEQLRVRGYADQVHLALEASMTVAMRRYVALGWGVALLPLSQQAMDMPGVTILPLSDTMPTEPIVALYRRGATHRPLARSFLEFLRKEAPNPR